MAKEDAKETVYPLGLSQTQVWMGMDQTPLTPGEYGRVIDINGKSPTFTLQTLTGTTIKFPKSELPFFLDIQLIAKNIYEDKPANDPSLLEWDTLKPATVRDQSPYIPNSKEPKQFKTDNLPGESFSPQQPQLPEIAVMTAQSLRRSGIQSVVIQNTGNEISYRTTAMLSMVINRTLNRTTLVDTDHNNPSFHTRDNDKIDQITTVSREVKDLPAPKN